ncbi:DUF1450 domain-containing protein [Alkalihalobacillus sp. LMS6]|uniref:DUF1450 domain-containing protein n=1 Tax=Alkalihalobacillus sp. LMS6 TaxID=2924034 RepID=UPI0020D02B4D|nr:DUF1450 domain-containing protein [Alkalihalobacillus sp. LMS6]UTR05503.1 DUF1450 domain-containing protein [Alkalihalobacillus sp. LMS6]
MNVRIECCMTNLDDGTAEAIEQLQSVPYTEIIDYGCLSHCGSCRHEHFLLVNDTYIAGTTVDELVKHVMNYVSSLNK